MMNNHKIDIVLIILALMMLASLSAFVMGWLNYPYGLLVLLLLFAARISHLHSRRD